MLLRRITKHVKDQNWFAVGIDFVIVVIGVFIGLQVANWNDSRADRASEREYLERLSFDLAQTIELNIVQSDRNLRMIDDLAATLSALDTCANTPETETALATGLYFLGRYNLPEFVSGSFDELNSTGNFQLIRDLEIRRKITTLYEYVERTYLIDRQLSGRVTPKVNYVRRFIRFNNPEDISNSRLDEQVDHKHLMMDFDLACRNDEFKNSIGAIREILLAVNSLTEFINAEAAKLKADIDQSLE